MRLLLPVGFFVAVALCLWLGMGRLEQASRAEELRYAEESVRRAAVHCYAVEGRYPSDLAYLEEHYGVLIDHDRYVVHYQSIASNLMPDIAVFPLAGD